MLLHEVGFTLVFHRGHLNWTEVKSKPFRKCMHSLSQMVLALDIHLWGKGRKEKRSIINPRPPSSDSPPSPPLSLLFLMFVVCVCTICMCWPGTPMCPRTPWNSCSSCLYFPSAETRKCTILMWCSSRTERGQGGEKLPFSSYCEEKCSPPEKGLIEGLLWCQSLPATTTKRYTTTGKPAFSSHFLMWNALKLRQSSFLPC